MCSRNKGTAVYVLCRDSYISISTCRNSKKGSRQDSRASLCMKEQYQLCEFTDVK